MKQLELELVVERRGRYVCTRKDGSTYITTQAPVEGLSEKSSLPPKDSSVAATKDTAAMKENTAAMKKKKRTYKKKA